MARKTARETVMKLLYERAMGGQGGNYVLLDMIDDKDITDLDMEYINQMVEGIQSHIEDLDQIIAKYIIGWKLQRLVKVDLSILRLALYEMKYRDDIPATVSINEAIELAKKYSNPESGSFINGVLASFLRDKQAGIEEK